LNSHIAEQTHQSTTSYKNNQKFQVTGNQIDSDDFQDNPDVSLTTNFLP
jgi:hypothetical protein